MQNADMIFYVFLTYGAVSGEELLKYPAAAAQLAALVEAKRSHNEDIRFAFKEKCTTVEGLNSLPQLRRALKLAQKNGDKVYVDDFRRIFVRCPADKRRRLIREINDFKNVFWETRAGERSFADLGILDLEELRSVVGSFRTKRRKASETELAPELRRRLTSKARIASITSRKESADASAKYIRNVYGTVLARRPQATLSEVATFLNSRNYKTARGGTWSASTVKRMLDRAERLGSTS